MGAWKTRARVWASVALAVGFPVLVVAVIAAVLLATVFLVRYSVSAGAHLLILVVPVAAALASAVRELQQLRRAQPLSGFEVSPTDEPRLWAEIHALAEAMGEAPPVRLVVNAETNASVTEHTGRREVRIGLPLLVGLTRAELRSVIAHELGHLAEGHTKGSRFVLRTEYLLVATVSRLHGGILRPLFVLYLNLYTRVSASVRREHEREADLWSARLAGVPAATRALARVRSIDLAWDAVLDTYRPAIAADGPRASLSEALVRVMDRSAELLERVGREDPPQASPYDSHPPDHERIAALRAAVISGQDLNSPGIRLADPDEPAWSWLTDPGARLAEFEATQLFPAPPGQPGQVRQPVDWGTVLTRHVLTTSADSAGRLMSAAQLLEPGGQPASAPTLDTVLRAMAAGRAAQLTQPLLRADIPRQHRDAMVRDLLVHLLSAAVTTVLAEADRVRAAPDFSPQGPWQLGFVAPDGQTYAWPFDEPIRAAAADPGATPALVELLQSAGVDLHAPVKTADRLVGAIEVGVVTGVRPSVRGPARAFLPSTRSNSHDLIVYDEGLLLRLTPRPDRVSLTRRIVLGIIPSAGHRNRTLARISELGDQIGDQPRAWAADPANQARWLDYSVVRSAGGRRSWADRSAYLLTLQLKDGSRLRLRTGRGTVVAGNVLPAIQAAIG